MFPGVVDIEQENLENEKVDGISSVSLPDRNKQAGGSGKGWVSFEATRED